MGDIERVLVIGLDGASWNIVDPLVKAGKLPAIENLINRGCRGDLESCIMPYTFPAWKCYSTGKNPGKLGVYWFLGVDMAREKVTVYNSTSFKSEELWDILGENDITCGVLDMPTTYPPKAINGFMVSYRPSRPTGYTYPEGLERELKERFHYKVEPAYRPEMGKDAALSAIKQVMEQRFEVAGYLLRKYTPAFFHITIFDIDTIQHFYSQEVVEDFWILIDRGIESLLEHLFDKNTCVILMSDHGQTEMKCAFQIGKWLMDKGFLTQKKGRLLLGTLLYRFGLSRANIFLMLRRARLIPLVKLYVPRKIRQRFMGVFPVMEETVSPDDPVGAIDWAKSKVIPLGGFYLYINRKLFGSEEELEEFKERIKAEMEEIKEPVTDGRFARVLKREDIYSGKYIERAPDLIVLPEEGYELSTSLRARSSWFYPLQVWNRMHRLQGIFLACGAGVKEGVEIQGASIYDLAPTILHIFGIPIPEDVDGKVLKEIFEEGSSLANREIEYLKIDERDRVKSAVRELKDRSGI